MRRKKVLRAAATLVAIWSWWRWGAPWANEPRTYHAIALYFGLGVAAAGLHVRALIRFNRMLKNVRRDEELGLADPGSSLFAANQRFRYIMRTAESALIVTVSIMGIVALHHERFARSTLYINTVITYLIGSVVVTGYLTLRDLRVVNTIKKISDDDAATLRPILRYRKVGDDGGK